LKISNRTKLVLLNVTIRIIWIREEGASEQGGDDVVKRFQKFVIAFVLVQII
jgi:hypothetical protein